MKIHSALFFTISILLLSGCQGKQAQDKRQPQAIPVKVVKVIAQDLEETIDYVGNVKARDEVMVYPKVSGKVLEKVKEDGSPVAKGEIIAYLDRDEVGLKFEKAPVESPITGIIGRVYVDIGENVTAQTPLALVVDMEEAKINLDIPEKYLARISAGQSAKVNVDAYPQEDFIGKVTKISPVVDIDTRSAPVEITLDNPRHLLKSGMFARVNLIIQRHKGARVIFKEAVIGKGEDRYVYTVQDNKAVLKKVGLGIRQGPYYEVVDGLEEGDLVVVMGQQRLYDNAPVSPEINNYQGEGR